MEKNLLVINCGSSSLKFQLCAVDDSAADAEGVRPLARGVINGIGKEAELDFRRTDGAPGLRLREPVPGYDRAVQAALEWLEETGLAAIHAGTLDGVGHRVVHGGVRFVRPTRVDETVLEALHELEALAPLHNGPSVAGIRAAWRAAGQRVPMVAVFDTAFHRTLPEHARQYALPAELARRHGIQRFGFHGTSCRSVLHHYCRLTGTEPARAHLVILHLGSGCSATAVMGGRSVETSMGFTPLEGLIMSTRSGDLDPALVAHLARKEGLVAEQVERLLNERSGLLGISGSSGDLNVLLGRQGEDERARLAVAMFCHRVRKYVGAYLAVVGEARAVVFTGGIGEHLPEIRSRVCADMDWAGLRLDEARNRAEGGGARCISPDDAALKAYVIPSDEERIIAWDSLQCLQGGEGAA